MGQRLGSSWNTHRRREAHRKPWPSPMIDGRWEGLPGGLTGGKMVSWLEKQYMQSPGRMRIPRKGWATRHRLTEASPLHGRRWV